MSLASLCTATATVKRKTTAAASSSNLGGQVVTLSTVYTAVPVSLQPRQGFTGPEAGKRQTDITHVIYSPQQLDLRTGDQFIIDSVTYLAQTWGDMAGRGVGMRIETIRKV